MILYYPLNIQPIKNKKTTKLFEICDKNYHKVWVKVNSEVRAKLLAKKVMGKFIHDISYYSADANKSSIPKSWQLTPKQF